MIINENIFPIDTILQVDSYQETVERWKRRAGALSKQCTDLSTVMRKYITGKIKELVKEIAMSEQEVCLY